MQREIDRVVAQGAAQPALRGRPSPSTLAATQVRCATFEQLTYCLHVGWTDSSPTEVRARITAAAAAEARSAPTATATVNTGDLDPLADLTASARMAPRARAAADRAELTDAARAVAKVWSIRHDILGEPYPRGFWRRHPEARPTGTGTGAGTTSYAARSGSASASPTATATPKAKPKKKSIADYPKKDTVLDPHQVREQVRSYWCGPTSTQMIVWGWTGKKRTQKHWANELGTTTSGTAISSIVRVVNRRTGWDNKAHAGPYITLDVKGWSYGKWYLLLARHVHDYRAPLVLHPILLKKYYPYLDDDASGHYQVGRGYFTRKDGVRMISYFEPWNQQRFDPSEPFIKRVQWQRAYRSYRANLAHPYHNIGV
ncbi:C39 family peptidase [Nocardioides sp.]|uniref:C39 family peptidase n=1 Tax=Nocardioides sp. TaxID=35761 RepID=UPI0035297CFB